jgi:hypothetical protein
VIEFVLRLLISFDFSNPALMNQSLLYSMNAPDLLTVHSEHPLD